MRTSYHHLTPDHRCQIYARNKRGVTQSGIVTDTGINQGVIRRELQRNMDFCGYRFLQAQRYGTKRLSKEACGSCDDALPRCTGAETLLRDNQWSSQQICGALNHDDSTKVSYETLYRHT